MRKPEEWVERFTVRSIRCVEACTALSARCELRSTSGLPALAERMPKYATAPELLCSGEVIPNRS